MKNNNKMLVAINEQINVELYSAYLYLAMAAYFEESNFKGIAHWMHIQAKEEMKHAMRFFKYVHERLWQVNLTDIEAVKPNSWQSVQDVFEAALAHEKKVTKMINNLMDMAVSIKDYPTQSCLKWFIDEQVEEEASFDEIIQKIKLIGKNQSLLLMLDAELGKRSSE